MFVMSLEKENLNNKNRKEFVFMSEERVKKFAMITFHHPLPRREDLMLV